MTILLGCCSLLGTRQLTTGQSSKHTLRALFMAMGSSVFVSLMSSQSSS